MNSLDTKEPIKDTSVTPRRAGLLGAGIPLGRWAGVPISARWSVLFTLALFADILAVSALPAARPGQTTAAYWLVGTLTAVVFLVTILAHEFAHAITARHYGLRIKRITLWMLGGVTEIDGESPSPRADALIAAAGPATSIGLGVISVALAWGIGGSGLAVAGLAWLAVISVFLGVFNLLPGAPLDGGRLLRALLWWRYRDRARAAYTAARVGRGLGFILIALGFFDVIATGSWGGLWLAFTGWFIIGGANLEAQAAQGDRLGDLRAVDVMVPGPTVLADWWTVEQVLGQAWPDQAQVQPFALMDFSGQATGALTLRELQRVPVERQAETRLRDIVRSRRPQPLRVKPETLLAAISVALRQAGGIAVVVDEYNHPIGVLTAADLARASATPTRQPASSS